MLPLLVFLACAPGPATPGSPSALAAVGVGRLADDAVAVQAAAREVEALADPATHPDGLSPEQVQALQEGVEDLRRHVDALQARLTEVERTIRPAAEAPLEGEPAPSP